MSVTEKSKYRLLIIDDNPAIHDDFRKILSPQSQSVADISAAESVLFGDSFETDDTPDYEIDCASQGQEGLALLEKSIVADNRYCMAFVDVRMPPGWDGVETITRLWKVDPSLQAVICTAYSDYSWEEMVRRLGRTDQLLILKKPFDNLEVHQMVCSLTEKWNLKQQSTTQLGNLEKLVAERTRELDTSLSLIQATLDSTADGILVIDKEGRTVGFNKKFLGIWNLSPSLIEAKPYEEMVNSVLWQLKDTEGFSNKFQELSEQLEAASYDLIEFVDGRIFERYSQPQRVGERIVGRVWSFREITERKKAERKIVEQASLLDLAQDAIVVRDLGNWITFWSQGAERLFGWSAEEVAGQQVTDLLFEDETAFNKYQEAVIAKGEWSGELELPTKNGERIFVSSRWTLVRDDEGHPKSVLAISSDLTERKKIESRLLRTQRMESIGTLASGVAHDLNNILSPIMMCAPLLRAGLPPKEMETLIHNIEISAQRGASIVKQLLTFGRGMEGVKAVVQLRHLVDEIIKITRDTFPKNITIESDIKKDLWPIIGDATHIHQVLLNLCINGRDAMPDGGKITINAENLEIDEHYASQEPDASAGPHIRLRISDTGTGIPAAVLEKIFDPFFTTKEQGKGTGLGLSTVMGIARSHGGFINVSSELNKGTAFSIFIPAAPDAQEAEIRPAAVLPRGNGELILVVDDEAGILNATCKLLEANGYKVITSSDGVEALALYTQNRENIAAVLTDVMMPVMDGAAMMRVLKRLDNEVKVIATSGLEQDARLEELKQMGIRAFIPKPFTADKVLITLRGVLDGEIVAVEE